MRLHHPCKRCHQCGLIFAILSFGFYFYGAGFLLYIDRMGKYKDVCSDDESVAILAQLVSFGTTFIKWSHQIIILVVKLLQ